MSHKDILTISDRSFRFEYPPNSIYRKTPETSSRPDSGSTDLVIKETKKSATPKNVQSNFTSPKRFSLGSSPPPSAGRTPMPKRSRKSIGQSPAAKRASLGNTPKQGTGVSPVKRLKAAEITPVKSTKRRSSATAVETLKQEKSVSPLRSPKVSEITRAEAPAKSPKREKTVSPVRSPKASKISPVKSPQREKTVSPVRSPKASKISPVKSPKRAKSVSPERSPKASKVSPAKSLKRRSRSASPVKKSPAKGRSSPTKSPRTFKRVSSAGRRKNVSFGPYLSPERFDRMMPPSTPVKKGSLPPATAVRSLQRRLSAPHIDSPAPLPLKQGLNARKSSSSSLSFSAIQEESPRATPSKSPSTKSPKLKKSSPKGASPKTTSPKTTSPRGISPKTTSPRGTSPETTSPRSASPKTTSPRGTSPKTTSPRSASPKTTSPRSASPKATSPRGTSPKTTSPRGTSPKNSSPRSASPKKTSPRRASLKTTSPRGTSPMKVSSPKKASASPLKSPTIKESPLTKKAGTFSPKSISPRKSPSPRSTPISNPKKNLGKSPSPKKVVSSPRKMLRKGPSPRITVTSQRRSSGKIPSPSKVSSSPMKSVGPILSPRLPRTNATPRKPVSPKSKDSPPAGNLFEEEPLDEFDRLLLSSSSDESTPSTPVAANQVGVPKIPTPGSPDSNKSQALRTIHARVGNSPSTSVKKRTPRAPRLFSEVLKDGLHIVTAAYPRRKRSMTRGPKKGAKVLVGLAKRKKGRPLISKTPKVGPQRSTRHANAPDTIIISKKTKAISPSSSSPPQLILDPEASPSKRTPLPASNKRTNRRSQYGDESMNLSAFPSPSNITTDVFVSPLQSDLGGGSPKKGAMISPFMEVQGKRRSKAKSQSPKSPLGIKRLVKTPAKTPRADYDTNVGGMKHIFERNVDEEGGDYTDVSGIGKLLKAPRRSYVATYVHVEAAKGLINRASRKSPKSDYSNVDGVKELFGQGSSSGRGYTSPEDLERLFATPEVQPKPTYKRPVGVATLMRSPAVPPVIQTENKVTPRKSLNSPSSNLVDNTPNSLKRKATSPKGSALKKQALEEVSPVITPTRSGRHSNSPNILPTGRASGSPKKVNTTPKINSPVVSVKTPPSKSPSPKQPKNKKRATPSTATISPRRSVTPRSMSSSPESNLTLAQYANTPGRSPPIAKSKSPLTRSPTASPKKSPPPSKSATSKETDDETNSPKTAKRAVRGRQPAAKKTATKGKRKAAKSPEIVEELVLSRSKRGRGAALPKPSSPVISNTPQVETHTSPEVKQESVGRGRRGGKTAKPTKAASPSKSLSPLESPAKSTPAKGRRGRTAAKVTLPSPEKPATPVQVRGRRGKAAKKSPSPNISTRKSISPVKVASPTQADKTSNDLQQKAATPVPARGRGRGRAAAKRSPSPKQPSPVKSVSPSKILSPAKSDLQEKPVATRGRRGRVAAKRSLSPKQPSPVKTESVSPAKTPSPEMKAPRPTRGKAKSIAVHKAKSPSPKPIASPSNKSSPKAIKGKRGLRGGAKASAEASPTVVENSSTRGKRVRIDSEVEATPTRANKRTRRVQFPELTPLSPTPAKQRGRAHKNANAVIDESPASGKDEESVVGEKKPVARRGRRVLSTEEEQEESPPKKVAKAGKGKVTENQTTVAKTRGRKGKTNEKTTPQKTTREAANRKADLDSPVSSELSSPSPKGRKVQKKTASPKVLRKSTRNRK